MIKLGDRGHHSSLVDLDSFLTLKIFLPFFLPFPMAAFFVVLADSKSSSKLLALFDLRLGKLMDLMALQIPRIWPTTILSLLRLQLFAKSVALVVDLIFVYATFMLA